MKISYETENQDERFCALCGSVGAMNRHHIVGGNGKRKQCETLWSLIDLCPICHTWIHSSAGSGALLDMRLQLQMRYFAAGKTDEEVRLLLGGKLYLKDGEIFK